MLLSREVHVPQETAALISAIEQEVPQVEAWYAGAFSSSVRAPSLELGVQGTCHVPAAHSPVASPTSAGLTPQDAFVQKLIAYNPDLRGKDAMIKRFMKEYCP